jgi:putative flippase GtrA
MFYKAQFSAGIATGIDFIVMILCFQFAGITLGVAVALGALVGGAVNFLINRYWAFRAREGMFLFQVIAYISVCFLSALLNVYGVLIVMSFVSFSYIVVRVIVASTVALAVNYPLHKKIVFMK